MSKKIIIVFLLLLLLNTVSAYKDPTTFPIEYDDGASNDIFDIKTDKEKYFGVYGDTVYLKITNLSNETQDFDIKTFVSNNNMRINKVSKWEEQTEYIPNMVLEDVNAFINIQELEDPQNCEAWGYTDYNSTDCIYITQDYVQNGLKEQKYNIWETKEPVAIPDGKQKPPNFIDLGGFKGLHIQANKTKFFVLDLKYNNFSEGEFIICANDDCLDPFWDSDWTSKYLLNDFVVPDGNLVVGEWIDIIGVDFSALSLACSDANDFTVVNEVTQTELAKVDLQNWDGTNTDSDVNVLFVSDINADAGTYQGTFAFYTNNSDCANPTNRTDWNGLYDDFSDGDHTNNPTWTIEDGATDITDFKMVTDGHVEYQNYTPISIVNQTTWKIEMLAELGNEGGMAIHSSSANYYTGAGYHFFWNSAGMTIYRLNNPGTTVLIAEAPNFNDSQFYEIEIIRNESGLITYFRDSIEIASVIDNTHDDFLNLWVHGRYENYSIDQVGFDRAKQYSYVLGAEQELLLDANITFIVNQGTGAIYDINGFNIDFNVNAHDQTNVNSPITVSDINYGDYLITISKNGWTDGNTFVLVVDGNKTITKTIDKFVYPTLVQFEKEGAVTTSITAYQNVEEWTYETSYGSTTATDLSCAFWITSNNIAERSGTWRIQSSTNGIMWTTRKETVRTLDANTVAGSIFIATTDFNVTDGNTFVRLQQKINVGTPFNLTTNDVVCHNFIARDQNSNYILDIHDTETGLETTNTEFTVKKGLQAIANVFNGLFYYYGDLIYTQTIAKGIGNIMGDIMGVPDSNSAEYPRTIDDGSVGIGAFAGYFPDLNASEDYNIQTYTKTSAGQTDFSYDLHMKYLNQREGEFDQNKAMNQTFTNTTYEKIETLTITPKEFGDFRAFAVVPFSCSLSNCDLNVQLGLSGSVYDQNSFSQRRVSGSTSSDIGILIIQWIFTNVNETSLNLDLYAKTNKGTITIEGGTLNIIHANDTNVLALEKPQIPIMITPIDGTTFSDEGIDYNCFSVGDDGSYNYDVNIVYKATGLIALNLQSTGDGNGSFHTTDLENNEFSADCSVTSTTGTSIFSNTDYEFTIINTITPAETDYERYYNPLDDRKDLVDENRFVNPELVGEQSGLLRNADQEIFLLTGILILLGVIILIGIFVIFKRGRK